MATLTYSTLDTLLNLNSGVPAATLEEILDCAIDALNLYSRGDLPNMSGTAGSKSVSLDSGQAGAVKLVARAIYHGFYKGIDTTTIQGMTLTAGDVLGNPAVLATLKEAARQLAEPDVDVG